jgi:hypothetical protein
MHRPLRGRGTSVGGAPISHALKPGRPGHGADAACADPQLLADPQGAVAVAEPVGEGSRGPRCAVVAGQCHQPGPRPAITCPTSRSPIGRHGQCGEPSTACGTSGVPSGCTGRCSPPSTPRTGTSRTCSVTPRMRSICGWPQPVTSSKPKPRTFTTSACSATGPTKTASAAAAAAPPPCWARIHDRGGNLRLLVAAWACQAAIWYSCVSPPRTCFRRIR